jgi:DNA polymerase-3 subunit delta
MPIYKKNDMAKVLKAVKQADSPQVYLIFGDRFLCRKVAAEIIAALVPGSRASANEVNHIDGDQEDPLKTLNLLKSYNIFAGQQIFQVTGSKLFHSKAVAQGIWNKALKAYQKKDIEVASRYVHQLAEIGKTEAVALADISDAKWRQSFGFTKPAGSLVWIGEAATLYPQNTEAGKKKGGKNSLTEEYEAALTVGFPAGNILILLAETVDKRKKFYKFIQKHAVVIDLMVDAGVSKGAKADQETVLKELIRQTLDDFGKKIEPQAVQALIERVGFHPVAIVRETEKLALYADEAAAITMRHLQEVVGRTREDALFEFTEAFVNFNLEQSLVLTARLIEAGMHPLVLVAGLRNQLHKLLLVRSFIESSEPAFVRGMTYGVFQKGYLPDLKEVRQEWMSELPNHPYALYMMFGRAQKMAISMLLNWMRELLAAELSLKSSGQPAVLVFERFLIGALALKK